MQERLTTHMQLMKFPLITDTHKDLELVMVHCVTSIAQGLFDVLGKAEF